MKPRQPRRTAGPRPPLEIAQILAWADEFHACVGRWPNRDDGKITGQLGLTWSAVNVALQQGHRGLRPGSSLPRLLLEHRGRVHRNHLPRFSIKQILAWADAHCKRTGAWPVRKSGPIHERPADTWFIVDHALRNGGRGLDGGSSLPRLLAKHRGVRNLSDPPPLTVKQILVWVDAYHQRTGAWPHMDTGPIAAPFAETWCEVDGALRQARRGLPARYGSLARLLTAERGVRNIKALPPLKLRDILRWASAFHDRTGKWPTHIAGPVAEVPGESWSGIHTALYAGKRGFPGGSSLYQVMRPLRQKARRGGKR